MNLKTYIKMEQFCDVCQCLMRYEVSQIAFRLVCDQCQMFKTPQHAVLFSSEDADKFSPNVTKVYGDITVQRWNEKCEKCGDFYYLYFQDENKDILYICKCSVDQAELQQSKQDGELSIDQVMQQNNIRQKFASQFVGNKKQIQYDFLPIMNAFDNK